MSVRGVDVEVGDKLRYLGGDEANCDTLEVGMVYPVKDVGEDGTYEIGVGDSYSIPWLVGKDDYNSDCFELVGDVGEADTLDLVVNLSQEVAQIKRELSDLRDAMQSQAHEDNERIERILADIVMLDERTQGVNNGGQKLLSKEVYIYDTE